MEQTKPWLGQLRLRLYSPRKGRLWVPGRPQMGWMQTQEGGGRNDTQVPCPATLMGLGTARRGTPLVVAAPGDLIWGLADA